jgi:uncharacterized glyoxalase superfamily protein PhnB
MQDWPGGISFFKTSSTWLALFPRQELAEDSTVSMESKGFAPFTLAHNVDSREDVDETLEQAVSAGAAIIKPAADTTWGGYSGYFADPDGFLWEVAWNPHFSIP